MSTRYKIRDPEGLYFLTSTVVGWIDVFTRKAYKNIIIDSLQFCQKIKGLQVFAYVIMSNHIHMIAKADEGLNLVNIMGDFKKYTARKIIDEILTSGKESRKDWLLYALALYAKQNRRQDQDYQLWQSDNHPVLLASPKFIYQKLNYIHNNPVKSGIVNVAAHCIYSSAGYYETGEGVLPVTVIDLGVSEGYVWMGL